MALKPYMKMAVFALLLALPRLRALSADPAEDMMKKADCFTCHSVTHKIVGPAYLDVAKKYKGASAAQIQVLVKKVKSGGSGNWGAVPMAAHPNIPDADLEKMVRWVLSRTKENAVEAAPAPAPAPVPAAAAAVPTAAPAAEPSAGADQSSKPKKRAHHVQLPPDEIEQPLAYGTDEQVKDLMEKQGCMGCHSGLNGAGDPEDMPWPTFLKIENKYKSSRPVEALVKKVRDNDGKLDWGSIPHPQFNNLPAEAVQNMVGYILDGKASKASQAAPQVELSAEEWMKTKADCFTCHSVEHKVIGPAYKDVAKKYAGASDAQIKVLVKKVRMGGSGNWGNVPMAPHPAATDAQLEKAVRWVLEQK